MKLMNIYQNFWLRNLIVLTFFMMLIFFCVYTDYNDQINFKKVGYSLVVKKIIIAIIPMYVLQIISNVGLIKELFIKKKYKTFVVSFILYWFLAHFFLGWYFRINEIGKFSLISTVGTILNGSGIYFLHLWILLNIRKGRKELFNTQLELSLLKEQLNPHFLLNAMNNLYGEALSVPENVAERILNLSKLLRYQVETSKKDLIVLSEEFNFLKQYVEYYKFRNERLIVMQSSTGNMDDVYIPPLLLMSLVENAVKFSSETDNPYIVFEINVESNSLSFIMQNNFLDQGMQSKGTGIGLSNLQRRLEVYGYRHEFTCSKEDELFIAKLNIWGLSTVA
ncbi:histidine kinase [Flavobacterium aquidurense]|uniref:sensor histidine kinase n=1 Tax=Flavobacterium aquidurense TaxID=362413 RepID=UPI000910D5F7|nr:histidine kinase [Flavobacterium aquidurense]OXA70463.1 histidine kinase [Flavobacterium aquidurense]SHH73013.1 GHKL domain-containing protein [Flavobacterium frigidimaris]